MQKTYGIALIGCGLMGDSHAADIYYRDGIRMEYVCDTDEEKARLFCKKYGARRQTQNYMDCVLSDQVDIVIISTPPATHLSILKACLDNHKHVLCEKPVAGTWEETQEFVRLVKENPQCKVLVGHILRHNATYQRIAEMIHEGAIGKPVVFRMVQNHHTMNWPKYLADIKQSAPLVNCGIHYIDVMQWFSGSQVVDVQAIGARTEADVPKDTYNYGLMSVHLADGSLGFYEAGWGNTFSASNLKEFVGPTGRICLTYQKDRTQHQEEGDLIEYYRYPQKTYEIINLRSNRRPTFQQLEHLIRMIETGCEPVPSLDEMLHCMKMCLEADRQICRSLQGAAPISTEISG